MPTTYRRRGRQGGHGRRRLSAALVLVTALTLGTLAGCGGVGSPDSTATSSSDGAAGPSPTDTDEDKPEYVALGDSYTAAPYVPYTDTDLGCYRSTGNYPSLVARALPTYRLTDVSCSGASSTSMTGGQVIGDQVNLAQFGALDKDTALVTVGIGANDLKLFSTLVRTCTQSFPIPGGSPCTDELTEGGVDQLRAKLRETLGRVTALIRAIRDRAPKARIIVVDYPRLAPSGNTSCPELPIEPGDLPYVRSITELLSRTVQTAARDADVGASALDLWQASVGHDICSADPWINGDISDPERAADYHPFAEEQQAVARLVLAELDAG